MHPHERPHSGVPPQQRQRHRKTELRSLALTLGVTTVILLAELVGGVLSRSLALLADAGHMLSDALAIALAYVALTLASRPATPEKTYGWYRLEILAALINGVSLVVISLLIFWEAYERLYSPPEVETGLMMTVAAIGLVANGLGLFFLSGHHQSLNLRGAYLHVLGDLLSSVGVVAGGFAMWWTGNFLIDPLISVAIGIVIIFGAWRLLRESVDVLLEATPDGIEYRRVAAAISAVEGVEGVHDLHIWSLTSGMHALSCHIEIKQQLMAEADYLLDRLSGVLRQEFAIEHTTIQIEPEDFSQRRAVHWQLSGGQELP